VECTLKFGEQDPGLRTLVLKEELHRLERAGPSCGPTKVFCKFSANHGDMSAIDVRTDGRAKTGRRTIVIPLALVAVLGLAFAYLFLTAEVKTSAPLGASAEVEGGVASITGVIPLESDGWLPPSPVATLQKDPQEGAHRVRIQVQFTALDKTGLPLDPEGFFVDGLGSGMPGPLWTSSSSTTLAQGESVNTTMVFELPDKAIALVLEDAAGSRLSLGVEHHTAG
jgi:hypothetical protein